MPVDLESRIRAYARGLEQACPPLTESEIAERLSRPSSSLRLDPPGWLTAVAAAVLVMVAVGLAAWFVREAGVEQVVDLPPFPQTTFPPQRTDAGEIVVTASALGDIRWHKVVGDVESVPSAFQGFGATLEGFVGVEGEVQWSSPDGIRWERRQLPLFEGSRPVLVESNDALWLIGVGQRPKEGPAGVWRYSDGQSWSEVPVVGESRVDMSELGSVNTVYSIASNGAVTALSWTLEGYGTGTSEDEWLTLSELAVRDGGGPFRRTEAPWTGQLYQGPVSLATVGDTLFAYILDRRLHTVSVWSSTDGRTWKSHPAPAFGHPRARTVHELQLMEREGRLLAAVNGPPVGPNHARVLLWWSDDGVTWEQVPEAPATSGYLWLGTVERGWIAVDYEALHRELWVSPDGLSWQPVDTSGLDMDPERIIPRSATARGTIFLMEEGDGRVMWVGSLRP